MVNLCSPNKPKDKSFSELIKLVGDHLQPKPSILAERFRFRQCRQACDVTVSSYVAVLKKMAMNCDFGTTLDDNLRDQFVCGINSDTIRQRLFAEDGISFSKAVQLANTIEAANRDAHAVEAAQRPSADVHRVQAAGCAACGDTRHRWAECRFRLFECSKCRRTGHLRRMCPDEAAAGASVARGGSARQPEPAQPPAAGGSRGGWRGRGSWRGPRGGGGAGRRRGGRWHQPTHHLRDEDPAAAEDRAQDGEQEDDEPVYQMSLRNYQPVSLNILVNNVVLKMEIDTGSALSCISKQTYEACFPSVPLRECVLSLTFYDGSKIRPLGYLEVQCTYKGLSKTLDLYVIDKGTTSLLGRQWLTELMVDIPKFNLNNLSASPTVPNINKHVNDIHSRYNELFEGGLGRFTGGAAHLVVKAGATPVFCRARPLPYALRARVDAELDAMLASGVIEPVESSDWATPLVIANKPDGSLRICADYKVTLNPYLAVDKYPVPKIEDLFTNLNGSSLYSRIDLSQAYNQVELNDPQKYTVINTHRGLFKYNRLVYGLASSPGIFQRLMINLFKDIPNVVIFLDDILIASSTLESHIETLYKVLDRIRDYGLKIKKQKCVFFTNEIKFLGYIIDKNGIRVDPEKVRSILEMRAPKDLYELRSFLGMVNFYGKFIKNLSFILAPLYELLKKNNSWIWGRKQTEAFVTIKNLLSSTGVLAHYDPSQEAVVTCDASAHGLGAVLAQRDAAGAERAVIYVSRALTPAEINYSQIHKEALAIVFAVTKLHQYLYGRHFTLRTDHKPLVSIFGPGKGIPSMTASRLQRWALTLSAYDFNIEYVSTDKNTADCLSRMISAHKSDSVKLGEQPEQTYLHFASDALLLDYNDLKKITQRDPLLSRVISYVKDGWPKETEIKELKPFFNRKNEIYIELGCLMWGHRVIIPSECRSKVLKELHDSHMGVTKTKAISRSYVWWPGIDEAIAETCARCAVCAAVADAPPAHAPRAWPWPDRPWTRLHLDFMGPIAGHTYLVLVDSCTKWIEVIKMVSTSAKQVIIKLREIFATFGLPKQVVSDNGPPFTSMEFKDFLSSNGITQTFSAPYHPASNGLAENAVRTCKKVIKKALLEKVDPEIALCRFLLLYRNTEHCTTGESPAQLLQGRTLRTRLDKLKPDREQHVQAAQQRQLAAAGGGRRAVAPGQAVWCRDYRATQGTRWSPGVVVDRLGTTDYNVRLVDGTVIHRHIDQLKIRPVGEEEPSDNTASPYLANTVVSPLIFPSESPGVSADSGPPGGSRRASGGEGRGSPAAPAPQQSQAPAPVERRYPLRDRRPPVRLGIDIDDLFCIA
ncbi:hypothetical protein JYU34_003593 [Plutella xylostella]|uniref:RNA-directed DNA polymerase n=1 Tax=Plutella xylostella TaxID=51655 RepID=A0ABQ7R0E9_PLUXY|nr:hypothetical protein JYU34_003593 [Plutella xylostella]